MPLARRANCSRGPKMIVFCAFTFDPEAAKDIDALKGITALKAQMNTDLLTEDLKKARSQQPELLADGPARRGAARKTADGRWQVEVNGFDYFDTVKGELISGGKTQDRDVVTRHRLRRPQPLSRTRCSSPWPARTRAG
jgi:hypothetical protein